jgi:uncharacterized protein (TIGR03437 family)
VNVTEPGLDAQPWFKTGGFQYVVALFSDGTFVLPVRAIQGLASRPAKPGDEIVLYGVGFGPVTPDISAGLLVEQADTLASSFQMSIGGVPVTNVPYRISPELHGLVSLQRRAATVGTGAVPLTLTVGGGPERRRCISR